MSDLDVVEDQPEVAGNSPYVTASRVLLSVRSMMCVKISGNSGAMRG